MSMNLPKLKAHFKGMIEQRSIELKDIGKAGIAMYI